MSNYDNSEYEDSYQDYDIGPYTEDDSIYDYDDENTDSIMICNKHKEDFYEKFDYQDDEICYDNNGTNENTDFHCFSNFVTGNNEETITELEDEDKLLNKFKYKNENIIFLDTETTELDNPTLIQLAYKYKDKYFNKYYSTGGVPISIAAMAVHHITEKKIKGKQTFNESLDKIDLGELLKKNILIAHNAKFDIKVLINHGVVTHNYIDTLKIARYLRPKLEQHKEQYLRYYFNIELNENENVNAHDALGDIIILEKIFNIMYNSFQDKHPSWDDDTIYKKMIEISNNPILLYICSFGKHKGELWKNIPYDYLHRIVYKREAGTDDEDLIYTAKYYMDIKKSRTNLNDNYQDIPF